MAETAAATPGTATGTYTPGAFVWHELQTGDADKASQFYSDLLGWTIKSVDMEGGMRYHLIHVGDKQIGGIFASHAPGVPTYWSNYVSVPDVDAAADTAKASGGHLHLSPQDIPNVGRFAVVADPQGAVFNLFKSMHGDPDTSGMPANGEFGWDHLNTTDVAGAADFYAKVVGWTPVPQGDNGGMFKFGELMEASYEKSPEGVPASWLTHIFVANQAEATRKAEGLGARVLMTNVEAGPFGTFSVIQDPTGGVISLFEPKPH